MTEVRLTLTRPEAFVITHVSDLYGLLRAIDGAFPPDSTLYLEGTSIAQDVKDVLRTRAVTPPFEVEANTLYPRPETFYLPLVGDNLQRLREVAERHAEPEVCDHLAVLRGERVLLSAHDAGAGDVLLSRQLPAATIDRIRATLTTT